MKLDSNILCIYGLDLNQLLENQMIGVFYSNGKVPEYQKNPSKISTNQQSDSFGPLENYLMQRGSEYLMCPIFK